MLCRESALNRSAYRAGASASAAADAGIAVDDILAVALRDGVNRAVAGASAASDALVIDNIRHREHLHINLQAHYITFI